jgi:hypothetical protein
VLLSPGTFNAAGVPPMAVERATLANIIAAFNRWYQRCSMKKENVAIFFFSGHGLEKEIQILLAEDFGDPAVGNLWHNSIDFTSSWYGMAECAAATQCYYIDSCRETPLDLLRTSNANAYVLKTTQLLQFPDRDAYVLKAAAPGKKAYGPSNAPSYFTDALVRCLNGVGAAYWNGNCWKVTTASLTDAVTRMVRRTKPAGGQKLTCTRGGESSFTGEIHEFTGTATVMAQVSCDPGDALSQATLSLNDGTTPRTRAPNPEPWEVDVQSGQYDVSAAFPGPPFLTRTLSGVLVMPPFSPIVVRVQ